MASAATQPLTLDTLVVNPRLARRLPPAVARRYHALPVAEDHGHVTVVMANPEDALAREAILAALGTLPCLVRGDAAAIDALLETIWQDGSRDVPTLLVCAGDGPECNRVQAYAQALGELLDAPVWEMAAKAELSTQAGDPASQKLVVLGGQAQARVEPLLSEWSKRGLPVPSVLFARQPRWPLQRILLVLQGRQGDDAAVEWTVRLARIGGAAVSVLVVVPPVPAMYHGLARMQHSLAAVLSADTPLGEQLRRVACHLVDWEIDTTLRLRQGVPDWQIHQEVIEGEFDLLVVAAEQQSWWARRLVDGLIHRLLHSVDRPMLVASPAAA